MATTTTTTAGASSAGSPVPTEASAALEAALADFDLPALRTAFEDQGRFLLLDDFLPAPLLEALAVEARDLVPSLVRSYIPGHKRSGSIDFHTLEREAPATVAFYRDLAWMRFLEGIVGEPLLLCPERDPHSCALYAYTEEGDHVGWHYDTSFYAGRRYTVLVGVEDESSARLVCDLHAKEKGRAVERLEVRTRPGTLVLFDGALLHHKVSPVRAGERRLMISMEYVSDAHMNPVLRFVSNVKDAVAYFGFRRVFLRR